jgi:hypothetical protein
MVVVMMMVYTSEMLLVVILAGALRRHQPVLLAAPSLHSGTASPVTQVLHIIVDVVGGGRVL